jgi:peptide/nickel transport system substrate-binding protein
MSGKRAVLSLLLILVLLGSMLAACGGTPEPTEAPPTAAVEPTTAPEPTEPPAEKDLLDLVMEAGTLVVSTDPNYAPQSFLNDDGELDGFDVEVAKEVASRMGVEIAFETPDWDMITGGNWGGRWDVSIGSMTPTEQRSEVLWFSEPYYYVPASFAVHKDNTTITSPDDLADANVGLGTATTYEDYLNGILAMLSGEIVFPPPAVGEITAYSTDQEAIQDLALGDGVRLDAVMSAQPTIVGAIEEGVPIKELGTPAFYEGLVAAFDKNRGPSDKMLAKVNEIFADMHADGTLKELSLKWYGVDYTTILRPGEGETPSEDLLVISAECKNNKVKEIAAIDEYTVRFTMCKPTPTLLAAMAFVPFYIQPREWIEEKAGTTELLERPIGTGPYYIESWNRGDSIIFKRFDDYWGEPAETETLVFRWATEGAARLLELQAGTVDHIVKLSPDDYETVQNDPNLQFLPKPAPNIMYLGMADSLDVFGENPGGPTIFADVKVRQAIAMGIDRQRLVDNFYPAGSEVATHFTPCSIPNGCVGDDWYEFDAAAARDLLAEAGYPDGFQTTIYYRDVFRDYLPEPGLVAQDLQAQLKDNLNIDAEIVVMESGEFIDESTAGRLDGLYMLGWSADYLHITNFLDFHFGRSNPQFGQPHPEIYEILEEASQIGDEAVAADLYTQANNAIKDLVPMVPMARGAPADAALADVVNAHTAVLGPPRLWKFIPGDRDTLVYLKAAEPISLYCMDETDGESLDACTMVTEGLYMYDEFGAAQPTLATRYEVNEDATVWTFYLQEGIKFHDGSMLDANDVVRSLDAGMNAASPYHIGNTGAFEYPSYLFDALMNVEE